MNIDVIPERFQKLSFEDSDRLDFGNKQEMNYR
eukprot:UN05508